MKQSRILAVVPARGGSKRLPGKNIRPLAGLPLIAWTIRAAKASGMFSDVLVSTDAEEIAVIAREHGALAPWLRPPDISGDTATSIDVALHAVSAYEAVSGSVGSLMLLQPTSPFRSAETIRSAVELHVQAGMAPVVSVCPAAAHPAWCFRIEDDGCMQRYLDIDSLTLRSQDLLPAYQLNGAIYLTTVEDLRREHSFVSARTRALVVSQPVESLDIDDYWDWQIAECVIAARPQLKAQD